MAQANKDAAPRIYSYIRFSTPEQALGDSERRQLDDAKAWAARRGGVLDESLRLTDRGLSGYRGTHRKSGALGRFLELVEAGEIPTGSVLLVENIDRLSREGVATALREIIFKLWDRGIILQTLHPEESYPPGSADDPRFIGLFFYLSRARDESSRKSQMLREARKGEREQARASRIILSRQCPNWLTVLDPGPGNRKHKIIVERKFEPIPEAVAAVREIFKLKLAGLGGRAIAVKLNATAAWKPKNGWRDSYIKKTLKNRAVIGEYQPHQQTTGKRLPLGEPIPNYYPQVVPPDMFFAVQELFKQNRGKGGRRDRVSNLFAHLAKCAYCGGTMHFVDKGDPPKGQKYLRCDNGYRGRGCARHVIRYDECENVVLENCHKLRPDQVLPNRDKQTALCDSLRLRIRGKEAEQREVEQRIENYIDQIGNTKSVTVRDRYEARIADLEKRKSELGAEINQDSRALGDAELGAQSFAKWSANLKALRDALAAGDVDLRRRLQSHLREFISKIEVFAVGYAKLYDLDAPVVRGKNGRPLPQYVEDLAEEIDAGFLETDPKWTATTEFREFLTYVKNRRMSKEGRFIRVHFKTGAWMDLVPAGSLASGVVLERLGNAKRTAEFSFVSPEINRLWRDFRKSEKKRGRRVKLDTTC